MDIERFMQGYKAAWEAKDAAMFSALFATDGEYHNTPFAVQRGHVQLADYWQRIKLQDDITLTHEVLEAKFEQGLCRECRLWWHSLPVAP